jgi:hypothetical protein
MYNPERGHSASFLSKIYCPEPSLVSPKASRLQRNSLDALPNSYHGADSCTNAGNNKTKMGARSRGNTIELTRGQSFDSVFPDSGASVVLSPLSRSSKHAAASINEWKNVVSPVNNTLVNQLQAL